MMQLSWRLVAPTSVRRRGTRADGIGASDQMKLANRMLATSTMGTRMNSAFQTLQNRVPVSSAWR